MFKHLHWISQAAGLLESTQPFAKSESEADGFSVCIKNSATEAWHIHIVPYILQNLYQLRHAVGPAGICCCHVYPASSWSNKQFTSFSTAVRSQNKVPSTRMDHLQQC